MNTPLVDLTPHSEARASEAGEQRSDETTELWKIMEKLIIGFRCNAIEDAERIHLMIEHLCITASREQLVRAMKILGREISLCPTDLRRNELYGYSWDKF